MALGTPRTHNMHRGHNPQHEAMPVKPASRLHEVKNPPLKVNEHNMHRSETLRPIPPITRPTTEIARTAPAYNTGKSKAAPTGKPGMTTSKTD